MYNTNGFPSAQHLQDLQDSLMTFMPDYIDVKMKDKRALLITHVYLPVFDIQFEAARLVEDIKTSYMLAMNEIIIPVLAFEYRILYTSLKKLETKLKTLNQFSELKTIRSEVEKYFKLKTISDSLYKDLEYWSETLDIEIDIKYYMSEMKKPYDPNEEK